MAKTISSRDVDLLFLIREEAIYASRIRDSLEFSESRIIRLPVPLVSRNEAIREARRKQYVRPSSITERTEEEELDIPAPKLPCRQDRPSDSESPSSGDESLALIDSPVPYVNPGINRRHTVDDNDALYSDASADLGRQMFTYSELMASKENRKGPVVRALRRLANLWLIDDKLNKDAMLSEILSQYRRRYPDEVQAYETERRTGSHKRVRHRPRRRPKAQRI